MRGRRQALEPPHGGETGLDLGSGAGFDAFLAARAVGPAGRVIGVDMTDEMLAKARANARQAGLSNVEFRKGYIEALPVEDASVDVVLSNCVINLVPDKAAVYREVARVLRPGGRMVVSDVVFELVRLRRQSLARSRHIDHRVDDHVGHVDPLRPQAPRHRLRENSLRRL